MRRFTVVEGSRPVAEQGRTRARFVGPIFRGRRLRQSLLIRQASADSPPSPEGGGASGEADHRSPSQHRVRIQRLRVLFISTQPFFEWRGSSIRVKFNLLALESLGLKVDLLTMPYGQNDAEVKSRVVRVPRLPGIRTIAIGPSAPKLLLDVFILFRGLALALTGRYDVIHATEEGGIIAWLLARLTGARCIYEKHSDPASYAKRGIRNLLMKGYAAVEKFTARRVDAVICTGPGLERQVREYAPSALAVHIPDIPSSLKEPEPAEVDRIAATLRSAPEEVIVTYVGSFAIYQGIDLLFEAIPLVLERHPGVRFVIVGGNDDEIETRRRALGDAASRVTFVGQVAPDPLAAYLKASDILLVPRRTGINTPLKVLDYFKAGVAIVATDAKANRLILDEECARLSPFDAGCFAAAIGDLVDNPDARRQLAAEGRHRYETTFNFDVFTERLGALYEKLTPPDFG